MDARPLDDSPSNPYAAPDAPLGAPVRPPRNPTRTAQATRLRHLDDEALVRSVAWSFGMVSVAFCLGSIIAFQVAPSVSGGELAVSCLLVSILTGLLTRGLARLRPRARLGSVATAGLGMIVVASMVWEALQVPRETAVFGLALLLVPLALVLYILLSRDGARVFSAEYQKAVEATPDLSAKTSCLVPLAFVLTAFWAVVAFYWEGQPR